MVLREDLELADNFFSLFRGNMHAYGTYAISSAPSMPGQKIRGSALTIHGEVTPELWSGHLTGHSGIGIIPIDEDNCCWWGAIDVDIYNLDINELIGRITRLKFPFVVCRSKSGGAHLFIFLSERVPAGIVQDKLRELAAILGYATAEIFPKQRQIKADRKDVGNWLNMPYQGSDDPLRYGISQNGERLSAEEFYRYAESRRISSDDFQDLSLQESENEVTENGPPCLKMLCNRGFPEGTRNKGLFNLGILARKKWPGDWRTRITGLNEMYMQPPLPPQEVADVVNRVGSKDYNYTCKQEPINSYCNRPLCKMMPFGVDDSPHLTISSLSKLDTDPPIWFLDVDGNRIELSTDDLQTQRRFQKVCMSQLGVYMQMRKREEWDALLIELMANKTIIKVSEDVTPSGQFLQHLENFCTGRVQGRAVEDLLEGKPFTIDRRTSFRITDLQRYLDHRNFKELKLNNISKLLKERRNGESKSAVLKGKSCSYWEIDAFDEQTEPHTVYPVERKTEF